MGRRKQNSKRKYDKYLDLESTPKAQKSSITFCDKSTQTVAIPKKKDLKLVESPIRKTTTPPKPKSSAIPPSTTLSASQCCDLLLDSFQGYWINQNCPQILDALRDIKAQLPNTKHIVSSVQGRRSTISTTKTLDSLTKSPKTTTKNSAPALTRPLTPQEQTKVNTRIHHISRTLSRNLVFMLNILNWFGILGKGYDIRVIKMIKTCLRTLEQEHCMGGVDRAGEDDADGDDARMISADRQGLRKRVCGGVRDEKMVFEEGRKLEIVEWSYLVRRLRQVCEEFLVGRGGEELGAGSGEVGAGEAIGKRNVGRGAGGRRSTRRRIVSVKAKEDAVMREERGGKKARSRKRG